MVCHRRSTSRARIRHSPRIPTRQHQRHEHQDHRQQLPRPPRRHQPRRHPRHQRSESDHQNHDTRPETRRHEPTHRQKEKEPASAEETDPFPARPVCEHPNHTRAPMQAAPTASALEVVSPPSPSGDYKGQGTHTPAATRQRCGGLSCRAMYGADDQTLRDRRSWRGRDSNPRPNGYEPFVLPSCTTPRRTREPSRLPRMSTPGLHIPAAYPPTFIVTRTPMPRLRVNQKEKKDHHRQRPRRGPQKRTPPPRLPIQGEHQRRTSEHLHDRAQHDQRGKKRVDQIPLHQARTRRTPRAHRRPVR